MGSGTNVATYLTLLCSWDKSDEVAQSLKESIEAGFASDPDLKFGSPEPSTGKRRIGGSSRRDSDRLVPLMPPHVALGALSSILQGQNAATASARHALLNTESSFTALEKALERGVQFGSRILSNAVGQRCGV